MTSTYSRVIVIGGGIVGCSILYHLAKAGCRDVLLLERAELTSGATWHAAGNVHTQSAFPNLSVLQAYSLRLYDGLSAEVGQDVGSHVVGGFFLARSAERMQEFKFLEGKFKAIGIEYDVVGPEDVKQSHPLINTEGLIGAAWDPEEGYVDPYSVTMGLALGARQNGAVIKTNKRIVSIQQRDQGWRLTDSNGDQYECETIVNAAGFWADEVARMVNARLPITNMEHHYMVTESIPEIDSLSTELPMIRDMDRDFYMRQEGKGLLVGPWEKDCRAAWNNQMAPWDFGQELFAPDFDRLEPYLEKICKSVPAFAHCGIKQCVNGAISFSPDARPIIGPLPGIPGYFVACGFLGGIAQAGGIGQSMSQWILNGEPELDLSFIDVARFGNWTSKEFARKRTFEVFPRRYEIIYPQHERSSGRPLRTTPLYGTQLNSGAVMGQAYGWERPLWYAPKGVKACDEPSFKRPNWWQHVGDECLAVAERVGVIDMCSYSKFDIQGSDAHAFLEFVCSANIPCIDGRMCLSLMLNPRGGIIGDLTVCRLKNDHYYAVGASLAEGIHKRWLQQHSAGFDVSINVVTEQFAALGVTGPNSRALLQMLSNDDFSNPEFPFMCCKFVEIGGVSCLALRVSYSGESGWELHCPIENSPRLYDILIENGPQHGLALVGTRALSNLRIEKGFRSWGNEITSETTPHAVGLQRFCSTRSDKNYVGRQAFEAANKINGPKRCFTTLIVNVDDADCWGSEPVYYNDHLIGYVTSGGYGWRVKASLAVAWIDANCCEPGTALQVDILGHRRAAKVVAEPIYDPQHSRMLA